MIALLHKLISLTVPAIIPVTLTILSIFLGLKAYRRKSGAYVRGAFTPCDSSACNDMYVAEILLENLKDRAVTILGVYLRLSYGYYVELEDFSDNPLILKPYETYRKEFGPIEFYACNSDKINLNRLLSDPKTDKQILLSTTDGKYRVRRRMGYWSPLTDYFKNHLTAIARPVRTIHNEKAIGGNIKLVVDFVEEDGRVTTVPIHPKDYQLRTFRDFQLTKESLESKESLEKFLWKQQGEGKLSCKGIKVYDLPLWRARVHDFYTGRNIQAEPYSRFQYYFLGRIYSVYVDWRRKRENRKRLANQQPTSAVPPIAASGQKSADTALVITPEAVQSLPPVHEEIESENSTED